MKTMIKRVAVGLLITTLLVGCGMSTEQIGEIVKTSMQKKFDSDAQLKKWHLSVNRVQVIKQSENRFQGIATVVHEGTSHDIPVEITADDSNVIWQVQPGAFMFVAQNELQKLQDRLK
jgi:ABC-type uncharacterized transport system auxiliary subunit